MRDAVTKRRDPHHCQHWARLLYRPLTISLRSRGTVYASFMTYQTVLHVRSIPAMECYCHCSLVSRRSCTNKATPAQSVDRRSENGCRSECTNVWCVPGGWIWIVLPRTAPHPLILARRPVLALLKPLHADVGDFGTGMP